MTFRSADRTLLENWGTLPLLARVGRAEISLAISSGAVEALGVDGKRNGRVLVRHSGDRIRFDVQTNRNAEDAVFCYLISR